MRGAIPPFLKYPFMAWCLVKHRDNFTFTLLAVKVCITCAVGRVPLNNTKGRNILVSVPEETRNMHCLGEGKSESMHLQSRGVNRNVVR
jgi:hypothetical protein